MATSPQQPAQEPALLGALEASGAFVLRYDDQGIVTAASHGCWSVLGVLPDELVGRPREHLVHPADRPPASALPARDVPPAEPVRRVMRWRHADGSWRHLASLRVDARTDEDAFVVLLRDVTVGTVVRRVSETVAREDGLQAAFGAVADQLGDLLPHDTAVLCVISPEGVRVRAVRGAPEAVRHIDRWVDLDPGAKALAVALPGVMSCPDVRRRPNDPFARAISPAVSYAVFPIRVGGALVGSLTLMGRDPGLDAPAGLALVEEVVDAVGGLLFLLADLARQRRVSTQLRESAQAALVEARTDSLTGLANRRAWEEGLVDLLERAGETGSELSIVMIDLDGLKAVNDASGHQAGDELLRSLGQAWRAQVRPGDLFARYGGDEFALALWSCPATSAALVVEGLRARLPEGCSVSAGVAGWDGVESAEHLLGRADGALYMAKRAGRGRTQQAGDGTDQVRSDVVHLPGPRTTSGRRS